MAGSIAAHFLSTASPGARRTCERPCWTLPSRVAITSYGPDVRRVDDLRQPQEVSDHFARATWVDL
jgi:hypothetical protein